MKHLRCIECGKAGHLKCTREKESKKIPIKTRVKDNLDEFFERRNTPIKERSEREKRMSFDYVEDIECTSDKKSKNKHRDSAKK